eukprot:Hpha_TRINITY_DN6220_c0_g1::TRINITY_DN6220_c0_g1_i1::g.23550::m.23550
MDCIQSPSQGLSPFKLCAPQPLLALDPYDTSGASWQEWTSVSCVAESDTPQENGTPLTPPEPCWPTEGMPQTPNVEPVPEPSPWDAVLAPLQRIRSLPDQTLQLVHTSGAFTSIRPNWGTATVQEARFAAAAEWCMDPSAVRVHSSNLQPLKRSGMGTALSDDIPLAQCAFPGGALFIVPTSPTDHLRDPAQAREEFLRKPLPERLARAAMLIKAIADNPRQCNLLQRELAAAADLGREDWCVPVLEAVADECAALLTHPTGNFLVRRCVEHWPTRILPVVGRCARGIAVELACDRHASYVLQACLASARGPESDILVLELMSAAPQLSTHAVGNYVLQSCVDECNSDLLHVAERVIGSEVTSRHQSAKLRQKLQQRKRTGLRASERSSSR